jgi:hypothetical protein
MSGQDAVNLASRIIERWGFPVLVALAVGWVLRNDVLLPLVDAHEKFLSELTATQKELVTAMNEQTRLLYTIQPRTAAYGPADDTPQN